MIAVSEDIDPTNTDAVLWSLAYRSNPVEDVHIEPYRSRGHAPNPDRKRLDSTMLIDATLKHSMPPLALPAREFMERAQAIWKELGLPPLTVRPPWHGYSLGDWSEALGCVCAQRRRRRMGEEWREYCEAAARRPYARDAGANCRGRRKLRDRVCGDASRFM